VLPDVVTLKLVRLNKSLINKFRTIVYQLPLTFCPLFVRVIFVNVVVPGIISLVRWPGDGQYVAAASSVSNSNIAKLPPGGLRGI